MSAIHKPLVVGMGRVGSLIALLLGELGMQVSGVDTVQAPYIPDNVDFIRADVTNPDVLAGICRGQDTVIACLSYHLILGVAQAALRAARALCHTPPG